MNLYYWIEIWDDITGLNIGLIQKLVKIFKSFFLEENFLSDINFWILY